MNRSVYDGHLDEPKTCSSDRAVPLGPKAVEIRTSSQTSKRIPTLSRSPVRRARFVVAIC